MSKFIISLDFEMFWGVSDSKTIEGYRRNVERVWEAVPEILVLFRHYNISATWATVGMLMCKNYSQWRAMIPSIYPKYDRGLCSNYNLREIIKDNPRLFFARPLVKQILECPNQEIASHTYSHLFCGESGVTLGQFRADITCSVEAGSSLGVSYKSIVFPRNQIKPCFLRILPEFGIQVYRGTPDHLLFREGHFVPGGYLGRMLRFADAWLPISGDNSFHSSHHDSLVNVPASLFLRPYSNSLGALDFLRLKRIKDQMTYAAVQGRNCHLWWHPHNFGGSINKNISFLRGVLEHYKRLKDMYGMDSVNMAAFSSQESL